LRPRGWIDVDVIVGWIRRLVVADEVEVEDVRLARYAW
jgi:hypothetical protein